MCGMCSQLNSDTKFGMLYVCNVVWNICKYLCTRCYSIETALILKNSKILLWSEYIHLGLNRVFANLTDCRLECGQDNFRC